MLRTIGVVGYGFVGSAVVRGFSLDGEIRIYDRNEEKCTHTFEEVVTSDFVFVCLPTPMEHAEGGRADLSIIEGFFDLASKCARPDSVFIIKSTVPIGTTHLLQKKYNLKIVHNPEFLTARTALIDFITPARNIVGSYDREARDKLGAFLKERFPGVSCFHDMNSDESEAIKYMANCFFAVKVTFFNEMRMLTDKLGLDWDRVLEGVMADGRIAKSHYQVPGHDGDRGYGGVCFPKDINALISIFEDNDLDPLLLSAAWEQNKNVRSNWDWASNSSAVSNSSQE